MSSDPDRPAHNQEREVSVTLAVAPLDKMDGKWGVCIFDEWYSGFVTPFDAWVFAVSNLMIDPLAGIPSKFRKWTYNPKVEEPRQLSFLFSKGLPC